MMCFWIVRERSQLGGPVMWLNTQVKTYQENMICYKRNNEDSMNVGKSRKWTLKMAGSKGAQVAI